MVQASFVKLSCFFIVGFGLGFRVYVKFSCFIIVGFAKLVYQTGTTLDITVTGYYR